MTIPIPFTYRCEDQPAFPEIGLRQRRYALHTDLLSWTPELVVELQIKVSPGDWYGLHASGFVVSLSPVWSWAEDHVWYDGAHCLYDLGFLRVMLGGRDCKKCSEG